MGDPVASEHIVVGDPVNVAARLEQAASPGDILIGEQTLRLVRDAVDADLLAPLELKGKSASRSRVPAGAPDPGRRRLPPSAGRAPWWGERASWACCAARSISSERLGSRVPALHGARGGRGREVSLLGAFADELGERATVLQGRCLPYGEGITFAPVVDAVTAAARLVDTDTPAEVRAKLLELLGDDADRDRVADRVAQVIGAGGEAVPEETLWAVRRLLESMASSRGVVFVIDDIQWAEPTLLDLIEYVADWSRDAPILLACMARPELLEVRPAWGGGKLNATAIALEPLSTEECQALVANLLAIDDVATRCGNGWRTRPRDIRCSPRRCSRRWSRTGSSSTRTVGG